MNDHDVRRAGAAEMGEAGEAGAAIPRRAAATTSAPPSRATRAVASVEPLSATTIRRTDGRGSWASTSGSEASSLSAGITTSRGAGGLRSLDTGGFYAMLLRPARGPLPRLISR